MSRIMRKMASFVLGAEPDTRNLITGNRNRMISGYPVPGIRLEPDNWIYAVPVSGSGYPGITG
jgi:hypothetical protein